jgi:hypothetical protein
MNSLPGRDILHDAIELLKEEIEPVDYRGTSRPSPSIEIDSHHAVSSLDKLWRDLIPDERVRDQPMHRQDYRTMDRSGLS